MKKQEISQKMIAYGHTFSDKRTLDAYKQMQKEKRERLKKRKQFDLGSQNPEDSKIRKHFAQEAKHFGIKL